MTNSSALRAASKVWRRKRDERQVCFFGSACRLLRIVLYNRRIDLMDAFEWQMVFTVLFLSPFAFIGIMKIMGYFKEVVLVRKGNVEAGIITENRGFKFTFGKPKGDHLEIGKNKMYQFNPKKLYRHGHKPLAIYNENSIAQLDPLNESENKLNTDRLSELLIRWFNLGVISTMSKEKLLTMLVLIAVVGSVAAAGISFINMQSSGMMESSLSGAIAALDSKVSALTPVQAAANTSNATVIIR